MLEQKSKKESLKTGFIPISIKHSVPVEIDSEVINKIKFLCQNIKSKEWSGVLFYDVTGTIKELDTFRIKVIDLLLMDKGTSGATEYTFNTDVPEYIMNHPNLLRARIGHIHSHNEMKSFFSGTDMSELFENSEVHNYYFSLIVNNNLDIEMKIASRLKANYTARDENGSDYLINTTDNVLVAIYPCHILTERPPVPQDFIDRMMSIIRKAERVFRSPKTEYKSGSKNSYTPSVMHENSVVLKDFLITILVGKDIAFKENIMTVSEALGVVQDRFLKDGMSDISEYTKTVVGEYFPLYFEMIGENQSNEQIIKDFHFVINRLKDFINYYPFVKDLLNSIQKLYDNYTSPTFTL